jgi:hypothetical protein
MGYTIMKRILLALFIAGGIHAEQHLPYIKPLNKEIVERFKDKTNYQLQLLQLIDEQFFYEVIGELFANDPCIIEDNLWLHACLAAGMDAGYIDADRIFRIQGNIEVDYADPILS